MKHTEQDEADAKKYARDIPPVEQHDWRVHAHRGFLAGRQSLRQEVDRLIEEAMEKERARCAGLLDAHTRFWNFGTIREEMLTGPWEKPNKGGGDE